MRVIKDLKSLNEWKLNQRDEGRAWTLVPTMGNLHDGHFSLMRRAKTRTDSVIASIYVNPTQFGPGEDFEAYPRTPRQDIDRLEIVGVDAVFMPDDALMYPYGQENAIRYLLPDAWVNTLCGAGRPGHFQGVVAVVSRLFHLIEPKYAVFGAKDYQQQWILRRMVEDLRFPIEIITGDIVREKDGLAMSSRNRYLSAEERKTAPILHDLLLRCQRAICAGQKVAPTLKRALKIMEKQGFEPHYLSLRRQSDLQETDELIESVVLLVAATLGTTRLIDNVAFTAGARH